MIQQMLAISGSLGFSTHLSEAVSSGAVFNDENRELLYAGFVSMIWQKPWGYGIMGDRYISYEYGLFYKPIYPHNIYLEVIINFGYVIGIIICALFTFFLFRAILIGNNKQYKVMILVLASTSFVKLLFSSSYWIDQMFFMLLGAMIAPFFLKNGQISN